MALRRRGTVPNACCSIPADRSHNGLAASKRHAVNKSAVFKLDHRCERQDALTTSTADPAATTRCLADAESPSDETEVLVVVDRSSCAQLVKWVPPCPILCIPVGGSG